MRNLSLLLVAVAVMVVMPGIMSASAIVNGGFETGDFTGWTRTGNTGFEAVTSIYVYDGEYAAQLGPVGSAGFLSQDISTMIGSTYTISFWLANAWNRQGPVIPNSFELFVNNVAFSTMFVNFPVVFPYTNFVTSFVATGATTNIKFGVRQDPDFWYLDQVEVIDNSVPEPTTFALIGAGLIGIALVARRRRA